MGIKVIIVMSKQMYCITSSVSIPEHPGTHPQATEQLLNLTELDQNHTHSMNKWKFFQTISFVYRNIKFANFLILIFSINILYVV